MSGITLEKTHVMLEKLAEYVMNELPKIKATMWGGVQTLGTSNFSQKEKGEGKQHSYEATNPRRAKVPTINRS